MIQELERYLPWNEQEAKDRELMLACLRDVPDIFRRTNRMMHMTASAWVVNPKRDRVLMVYHNIYRSWSWMGGHADGEEDLLSVALREIKEESGVQTHPVSEDIFSLEVLTVDGHEKKGEYVSSHLHLNITYLLEGDETCPLIVKADENSRVSWFGLDEAVRMSTEPWFCQRIYGKLNEKLAKYTIAK